MYGYHAIFDTCPQQPILIQTRTDIPIHILPVEGWILEDLRHYNRQLGRGRAQNTFKNRPSPDDPTMVVMEVQGVMSFPKLQSINACRFASFCFKIDEIPKFRHIQTQITLQVPKFG